MVGMYILIMNWQILSGSYYSAANFRRGCLKSPSNQGLVVLSQVIVDYINVFLGAPGARFGKWEACQEDATINEWALIGLRHLLIKTRPSKSTEEFIRGPLGLF